MQAAELVRKIRKIDIVTSRKVAESLAGGYHSVFKGRGVEFAEVRPYQPGDDIRFIDWNVTARTGEMFTKNFTEERELVVNLLVDVSASQNVGAKRPKREFTAEVAALLAHSAIANGDRVGLILFTDRVEKVLPPRKGRRHALRIIRELLGFEPRGTGTDVGQALETLNRVVRRRSVSFILSDFLSGLENFQRPARVAARRHDLIPVVIRDPLERALPPAGLVRVVDAERGIPVWIDAGNPAVRARFAQVVEQEQLALGKLFRELQTEPIRLVSGPDEDLARRETVRAFVRFFALRQSRR
jgi:uncharacterized protein (DUF58 family)